MHKKIKIRKKDVFAFVIPKIFDILRVIKISYTVRKYSYLKYKFR